MGVDGEWEMEKLESDVRVMAQKISEYRNTIPDRLGNTLVSAAVLPFISETDVPVVLGTQEQFSVDKIIQLKEIMSRNALNLPKVVKRVGECIEGIDSLDSLDITIHSAFKRPRF